MDSKCCQIWLLVAAVALSGCDLEERIRGILYDSDTDAVTPLGDDQERIEQRTVEPGASASRATGVQLRREMAPLRAVLEQPDDAHWFELETDGEEDWVVELSVAPEDDEFDPAIFLEIPGEGDHAPHRYDIAGAGEMETIPMFEVPAGESRRFFVSAGGDVAGGYELRLRRRLTAAAVAMEPNDYPHLATTLEIPGEVQGFYHRPHDRDVFFVPAESLRAAIYTLELSAVPGLEQTLRIYGDEQFESPLLEIPVSGHRPAVIPNLSLDADAGEQRGLYFALSAGEDFDRERGYRLRVIEHPPPDEDDDYRLEREPNDTAGAAQRIDFGDRIRGYLHAADDVDRFELSVAEPADEEELDGDQQAEDDAVEFDPRGERDAPSDPEETREEPEVVDPWETVPQKDPPAHVVQARLRPLSDAHRLSLRWIPEDGGEEAELVADEGEELVVCNRVLDPGGYQIEIRSVDTEAGFRPRSFDYELEVRDVADTRGLEIEPNDTPEQADRLESDRPRVGYIATDGDVDIYAFVVGPDEPREVDDDEGADGESDQRWGGEPTESVRVELEGNPLNLGFELLDDQGGRVASVSRQGPGGDEELQIDLPHGLYYVAVSAASGSSCEPYTIEVNPTP